MSSTVILLNEQNPQGIFVDPSVPLISVDDQGFTRGDGVFETMLSVNRRVRKLGMHLSRLESSARMLDLPDPEPEILRSAVERLMREATAGAETALGEEHIVKIIISRGPTQAVTSMQPGPYTLIMASPVPASIVKRRTEGVKAMLLPRGHEPMDNSAYPWLLAGAKTLSYAVNMAVLRYVQERGADDAIFITDERRVLEGATSSVLVPRLRTARRCCTRLSRATASCPVPRRARCSRRHARPVGSWASARSTRRICSSRMAVSSGSCASAVPFR